METTVLGFGTDEDETLSRRLRKLLRYGRKPVALLMNVPQRLLGVVVWTVATSAGQLVGSHPHACNDT